MVLGKACHFLQRVVDFKEMSEVEPGNRKCLRYNTSESGDEIWRFRIEGNGLFGTQERWKAWKRAARDKQLSQPVMAGFPAIRD